MTETIVLGGGCFWCTEALLKSLRGVGSVTSGYAAGDVANPTYDQICSGTTGHAEVIKINYDPNVIPLKDLLEVFMHMHNPTTLNAQGADVGTQYRSIILYSTDEQKKIAEDLIVELNESGEFTEKIVTEVKKLDEFYAAEDYHKDYYAQNQDKPYCQLVISPKLRKLREKYSSYLKKE